MGAIVLANCKCGFERRMSLGGGMRNHLTYCAFPCYCQDCKSLFVADFFSDDSNCKECGSDNILPYDDNEMRIKVKPILVRPVIRYVQQTFWEKLLGRKQEKIITCVNSGANVFDWNTNYKIGRDLSLTDEDYFCPKCHNYTLKFYRIGCWD
jgi:Zn finger protein HypA/HybF involved in hydrogenase expression